METEKNVRTVGGMLMEQKEKKKPYGSPRWNDTSIPSVVGKVELTQKQREEAAEWEARIHEKYGENK